jgi:hypothetical protein
MTKRYSAFSRVQHVNSHRTVRSLAHLVPLLLYGLLMLHEPAWAQTVVFEDNFDNEPLGLAVTSLSNWTVTAGNVDVIGSGFNDFYPGNGNYLDLDGTCGNATIQSTAISLVPGSYQLSFRIGSNPEGAGGNSLDVSLGTLFSQSFAQPALTPITVEIIVRTATVASLVFRETGPVDCTGSVLDAVVLTFNRPLVEAVAIDIKPGGFPNSINLGSAGTVAVAILSSATFDARNVDPSTVTLAGASISLRRQGALMASSEDVNGDGLPDLVVHVETAALTLTDGDTEAVFDGKTFDGTPIRGTDTIRVVP